MQSLRMLSKTAVASCNLHHVVSRIAKSVICKIWVVLQQLFSHICLAKLIISCCFAPFGRRASAARAKQQERINFAKQMCEKSC